MVTTGADCCSKMNRPVSRTHTVARGRAQSDAIRVAGASFGTVRRTHDRGRELLASGPQRTTDGARGPPGGRSPPAESLRGQHCPCGAGLRRARPPRRRPHAIATADSTSTNGNTALGIDADHPEQMETCRSDDATSADPASMKHPSPNRTACVSPSARRKLATLVLTQCENS